MRPMSFYDKLSELNDNLYKDPNRFPEFNLIDEYHGGSGVDIYLYQYNQDKILAIKGTELTPLNKLIKDFICDVTFIIPGWLTKQYKEALQYFRTLDYKHLIITGYSLGGSLAQMFGTYFDNEVICFEPFGIGSGEPKSNIINFGNIYDPIFTTNFNGHNGINYIIPVTFEQTKNPLHWHQPGFHGKPSQATRFDGTQLDLYTKYGLQIMDKSKQYIKNGIIPTTQDRINNLINKSKNN